MCEATATPPHLLLGLSFRPPFVALQAIMAKSTTVATVSIETGYLVRNWGFDIGNLTARW
jgi:hypothetical protein